MDAPRQPPLPAGRSCPVPPALIHGVRPGQWGHQPHAAPHSATLLGSHRLWPPRAQQGTTVLHKTPGPIPIISVPISVPVSIPIPISILS